MSVIVPSIDKLACRVHAGDERARMELHEMLDRHMERIVRRALLRGDASSSLSRKVAATARRLASEDLPASELTSLVAENLRRTVVNRLWGATEQFEPPADTVARS